MAYSLSLMVLLGLIADYLLRRLNLPGILGMLLVGILCGPHVFNIMSEELLLASSDFRMLALVVILLRAGLRLNRQTLNQVGRHVPAFALLPSTLEGIFAAFLGVSFFGVTYIEGALMGAAVAAVSPAVVVPFMVNYIEQGRGTKKGIPTLILASASVDNVFVIVVFTMILGIYLGSGDSVLWQLAQLPISIVFGAVSGLVVGYFLNGVFGKFNIRAAKMTIIVVSVSLLLLWLEKVVKPQIAVSALMGVMALGFILRERGGEIADKVSLKLSKVWIFAEIVLFIFVGAQVNVTVVWKAGLLGVALIFLAMFIRGIGTYISLVHSGLNHREKLFCVVSYIPKATVQAAVGALPLEAGVPHGELILAIAVLSIIVTAPIGAVGISKASDRWLNESRA